MPDTIISVEGVSKKFCRSLKKSLWYGLQDLASELTGQRREDVSLRKDEFWALSDVSFNVRQGESIGLIGRNGAGKTTLLRLLSGLIKPDTGRIEVKGRLQALIALGAGFNPVLTGRENIYINGAVVGIPKAEITRRFDEIVAFSGLADFIDAPVQSYSSGMTVRLGFSVAVHMEPDILLLDEVLAVGDIPFRAKCHRKLSELKEKGIPWILVSHDMGTIRNQTDQAIFLANGRVQHAGPPEETISEYLYSLSEEKAGFNTDAAESAERQSAQEIEITGVTLLDGHHRARAHFQTGEPLLIQIDYCAHITVRNPAFGVHIYGVRDEMLYTGTNTAISHLSLGDIEGAGSITFRIHSLPFLAGVYRIRVDIWDGQMAMRDKQNEAAYLHVKGGAYATGTVYIPHSWSVVAATSISRPVVPVAMLTQDRDTNAVNAPI